MITHVERITPNGNLVLNASLGDETIFFGKRCSFNHGNTRAGFAYWNVGTENRNPNHFFNPSTDLDPLLTFYEQIAPLEFDAPTKKSTGVQAEFTSPFRQGVLKCEFPLDYLADNAAPLRNDPHFHHLTLLEITSPYAAFTSVSEISAGSCRRAFAIKSHTDLSSYVAAFMQQTRGLPIERDHIIHHLQTIFRPYGTQ